MKKFLVGHIYTMFSVCDHECTWEYEVIKRTDKTITLKPVEYNIRPENKSKIKRVKIHVDPDNEEEYVRPLGSYSMNPILRASREIDKMEE